MMKYRSDRETSQIHSVQLFDEGDWIEVADIFPASFQVIYSLDEAESAKWQHFLRLVEVSVRAGIGDFNIDLIRIEIYEDSEGWLVVRSVFPDITPQLDRQNFERLGILMADGLVDCECLRRLFRAAANFNNALSSEILKLYLGGGLSFEAVWQQVTDPDTVWVQFISVLLPADVRSGVRKIAPKEMSFLMGWFSSADGTIGPNSSVGRRLMLTQLGALHGSGELNMGRAFQIAGLIWANRHLLPDYLLLLDTLRRVGDLRQKKVSVRKEENKKGQKTKRAKVKKARSAGRKARRK